MNSWTGWTIEVCRTCGRVARWPFCAHRDEAQIDGKPWCESVVVRPTTQRGWELAQLQETDPRNPR